MGPEPEGSAELNRRVSLLRQYAAPGTEVAIGDVQAGPYSIESVYEEYLSIPATVRRAVALEEEGWDALILGCYGDPGLDAFRELVSIPVVGPGEATALVAASLGHRFAIITVTKSVIIPMERQIRNVGVGDKLASVRAVDIPVLRLNHDREHTKEAILAEGHRAISDDRADTIILGCMSMGFLGIAEELAAMLGVPVLDPSRVSLKYAEALVGAGLSHSRLAYMLPPKLASGEAATASDLLQGIA
jgi:allantoin racemase